MLALVIKIRHGVHLVQALPERIVVRNISHINSLNLAERCIAKTGDQSTRCPGRSGYPFR